VWSQVLAAHPEIHGCQAPGHGRYA
jgi:hypothetical protein